MKKSFITIAMAMVMMVALAVPVYAWTDSSINKNNKGTIIEGDGNIVSKNNKGIINTGDVGCDNGAVVGGNIDNSSSVIISPGAITAEGGEGGEAYAEGGDGGSVCLSGNSINSNNADNSSVNSIGDVDNSNSNNANNSSTNTIGDLDNSADNSNENKQVNKQEVNIENPDEIKINSQMSPMAGQQVDTLGYYGETLEDHKYQDEILEFLLAAEGPKPFKVREHGFFTRKSSHSASKDLSVKEYDETTTVYVFRNMADLEANIKNYSIVGYADTFSKGKATLMDCFDQAVIDSGEMGGNIVVILDVDYINALKSTTTGLGGSGATGIMKGANQSSVFGAALGYASSKATPETDPFIHGMILYSAELPAEKVPEKAEPVDRFANE